MPSEFLSRARSSMLESAELLRAQAEYLRRTAVNYAAMKKPVWALRLRINAAKLEVRAAEILRGWA